MLLEVNGRQLEGLNGMAQGFGRKSLAGSMIGGIAETQPVIDYCTARTTSIKRMSVLQTRMCAIGSSSIWLHCKRHRETEAEIYFLENKMKCKLLWMSLPLLVSIGAIADSALAAEELKMSQTITRAGSQPASKGPAEYFTGNVKVELLFPANNTTPVSGAYVTFEPGARSAWHTHPAGQHLVVTAGLGWTQVWGGSIVEIHPGDVVWCPPGVKHWHGASPTSSMTHMALTGTVNGKNVEWMEKVTDDQYRK